MYVEPKQTAVAQTIRSTHVFGLEEVQGDAISNKVSNAIGGRGMRAGIESLHKR